MRHPQVFVFNHFKVPKQAHDFLFATGPEDKILISQTRHVEGFVDSIIALESEQVHPTLSVQINPYGHSHSVALTTTALELSAGPHVLHERALFTLKITSVTFLHLHKSSSALQSRAELKQRHSELFFGLVCGLENFYAVHSLHYPLTKYWVFAQRHDLLTAFQVNELGLHLHDL